MFDCVLAGGVLNVAMFACARFVEHAVAFKFARDNEATKAVAVITLWYWRKYHKKCYRHPALLRVVTPNRDSKQ